MVDFKEKRQKEHQNRQKQISSSCISHRGVIVKGQPQLASMRVDEHWPVGTAVSPVAQRPGC